MLCFLLKYYTIHMWHNWSIPKIIHTLYLICRVFFPNKFTFNLNSGSHLLCMCAIWFSLNGGVELIIVLIFICFKNAKGKKSYLFFFQHACGFWNLNLCPSFLIVLLFDLVLITFLSLQLNDNCICRQLKRKINNFFYCFVLSKKRWKKTFIFIISSNTVCLQSRHFSLNDEGNLCSKV